VAGVVEPLYTALFAGDLLKLRTLAPQEK